MTSVCVRMSILCVLHVNRYRTHLVAFLVKFVHPTLSKYQNQTTTFILMSIFIIYSGVNIGHGIGDFCVCEDEHFVCTSCQSMPYTSCSFYGQICTPHTFLVSKPDQYLYFDVYNHNLEWCEQWTWYW